MTGGKRAFIIIEMGQRGGRPDVDIHVGDVLELKKAHPCGSHEWLVLRVGMDFKLR